MSRKPVLVATDEPIAAMGIATLFAQDHDFELVDVCKTTSDLLAAAALRLPDVIVYGLPIERNLNVIREIRQASPESALVYWSRAVGTELAHQAVNMGVRGFISTTASAEHFKECVQIAARGELWMEQSLTMSLLGTKPVRLSRRQSELLGLLVQGLKNKEIAATLGISEGTVKAYLTTLFEKVGARDRFELALFGLKHLGEVRAAASGLAPLAGPEGIPRGRATQIRSMMALRPPVDE